MPVPAAGMLANQLFQGWSVSGLVTFQSGQPFTVADLVGGAYGFGGQPRGGMCKRAVTAPSGDSPLATCTPGTPTIGRPNVGPIETRFDYYINPNFFSHPLLVPFAGDSASTGFGSPACGTSTVVPFSRAATFRS